MYGNFVRDKFPPRHHLPSIVDVQIVHEHTKRHGLLWLTLALAAAGASAYAWQSGLLPH